MSMRIALAVVVLAWAASPVIAMPEAYYNPATGHVRLVNDTGGKLAAIFMQSETRTQFVTERSAYAMIEGSLLDTADTPLGFTYLNFPAGSYAIGKVIQPGTPPSDLRMGYYASFDPPPPLREVIVVPEPATPSLANVALMAMLSRRRRRRRPSAPSGRPGTGACFLERAAGRPST